MTDPNNFPEAEDTKTRVTAKINTAAGKSAPQIDLNAKAAAPDSSTMTRRTLKLQNLAGLASAPKSAVQAPVEQAAQPAEDTRTRRTVKLSSLAGGPAVKPLNIPKPVPAPAPAVRPQASDTVTRRTQKLEALDTQDVIAMTEDDLSAAGDTRTRKTVKISSAPPPPPTPSITSKPRQTVKVEGIAPAHTPVIDLDAKPGDTNTRKTVKITVPEASAPEIDLNATAGDDTRTRKSVKVEAPADGGKLKSSNVDDTVKLQRPAPKPAMPGSVTPAAQAGAPAVGGIKLNKPVAKPAMPKPAPAPAPAAATAPAEAPAEAAAEPAAEAAPTGNLGKNQKPPKQKKGLKVNTDALKDLGSAPMVQGDAPTTVAAATPKYKESTGINVSFAIFASLAALLLIFIALVAVTDYLNIWHPGESRIDLPIISDHVYKNIK